MVIAFDGLTLFALSIDFYDCSGAFILLFRNKSSFQVMSIII